MFKHKGKTRTYSHNLQIASLLSFVAGLVNVAGFFSVQHLTTNVTGHFAFLMDEIIKSNYITSIVFFLFILFTFGCPTVLCCWLMCFHHVNVNQFQFSRIEFLFNQTIIVSSSVRKQFSSGMFRFRRNETRPSKISRLC